MGGLGWGGGGCEGRRGEGREGGGVGKESERQEDIRMTTLSATGREM